MLVKKNGKVQLMIKTVNRREYEKVTEDQIRRGVMRKKIEDKKIEKQLLEGDLW